MNDLTVIYYTANGLPEGFDKIVRMHLDVAKGDYPLISVSQKPMDYGENICIGEIGRSHLNIYRQALLGAKHATTKYIALAEDDVLYSPDHFKHRCGPNLFAYNMSTWALYTWTDPPTYSYKDRINLSGLICEREYFIEAMEERFSRWPGESAPIRNWAEPGKYEDNLGVTKRQLEKFYTDVPNIVFSHETALSFANLGKRKRLGHFRAYDIPYWGKASDIVNYYHG
jgi:hypothetical protein